MNEVLQRVYEIGIVPVIALDDAEKAVPLAKALVKGGLPAAEVTFRTAAAEEAIKRIVAEAVSYTHLPYPGNPRPPGRNRACG